MSARKTERLLNLVICLLHTRHYLSAEQIRTTVAGYEDLADDAFKRKFERDKEDLRDLGVPLEVGSNSAFDDEPGYRIRRDEYAMPDVAFTPAELAVLDIAARTWQQAGFGAAASDALLKLRAAGVDADGSALPFTVATRVATPEAAFTPLQRGIAARQAVRFGYREPDAIRTLEPWGLVSWHGRWYVVGHDRDRDDTRVFRLSRIAGEVRSVGARDAFTTPDDVDVRALVLRAVGTEPPRITARLRVCAGTGHGLRRDALTVRPDGDGWDVVEVTIADARRLADEVLAYGPDVVILEPPEARDAIVARLRALVGAQ